ncbi:MAG: Uma2 family endonuclease [Synechococcales cyanobacterium M58_A2018_015]|nr:Uma2 family endonuclease [Synechococcales cyanobacterium M58_A2018_015]
MVNAMRPIVAQPVPLPVGEKRVVFRGLKWQEYKAIQQALGECRTAHLTYDRGVLEITMPLEIHEFAAELIGRFIYLLVAELGLKIKTMGSTTLERDDLDRSPEPDKAYYIQNQPLVAGKIVDLKTDPPPDLVVEVDITHTDIDQLGLYANIGVPEFWRYNGDLWRIYTLRDGNQEVESSPTFEFVPKQKLYEFLVQAQQDEVEAERRLREWVRTARGGA